MRFTGTLAAGAILALSVAENFASAKMTEASYFYNTSKPLIMAHRGSFGHFPEHSLASYEDAYYGGTDFIEMDLQLTKDGYLIC